VRIFQHVIDRPLSESILNAVVMKRKLSQDWLPDQQAGDKQSSEQSVPKSVHLLVLLNQMGGDLMDKEHP
jgi:hypothetical protein